MNHPTPDAPVPADDDHVAVVALLTEALRDRADAGPPVERDAAWQQIAEGRGGTGRRTTRLGPLLAVAAATALIVAASALIVTRHRGADPELGTFSPSTATVPPTTGAPGTVPSATTRPAPAGPPGAPEPVPSSKPPAPVPAPVPTSSATTATTAPSGPPDPVAPSPAGPTSTTAPAPPAASVPLHGGGLGTATFGQEADAALATLEATLGAPDGDTGWQAPGLWPFPVRAVNWTSLEVLFADRDGQQSLAGWVYRSPAVWPFPLRSGLTLGLSVEQLESQAPQPLTARGLQGSTGLCFEDGGTVCATLDPPWQRSGRPDQGTVNAYAAGLVVSG
jgi:hypothetical protein